MLNQEVDFLCFEPYSKVNLNEDPIIIPPCNHLIAMSSLDGIMDMQSYYDFKNGEITAIKSSSTPFSVKEIKGCPTCRGTLRSIPRYGRIVRRALLDEQTKKFTAWSREKMAPLAEKFQQEQALIIASQKDVASIKDAIDDSEDEYDGPLEDTVNKYRSKLPVLKGTTLKQIASLRAASAPRHKELLQLHRELASLKHQIRVQEQPFQRVYELVEVLRNYGRDISRFEFDSDVLQTSEFIRASAMLIRLELSLISDFFWLMRRTPTWEFQISSIDFTENIKGCEELIELAKAKMLPLQQAEGHVLAAAYFQIWRSMSVTETEDLRASAVRHIETAEEIIANNRSAAALIGEVGEIKRTINDGGFYQNVTTSEMAAVYKAMAGELRGTG